MKRYYAIALLAMLLAGVFAQAHAKSNSAQLMEFQQKVDGIFSPVFEPNKPGAAVLILKNWLNFTAKNNQ